MSKKLEALRKILESYTNCQTYQDTGRVIVNSWQSVNSISSNEHPFRTYYISPDKIYIENGTKKDKWILWSSGTHTYISRDFDKSCRRVDSVADAFKTVLYKHSKTTLAPLLLIPSLRDLDQGFFNNKFKVSELDNNTLHYVTECKPLLRAELKVLRESRTISEIIIRHDWWHSAADGFGYETTETIWHYDTAYFDKDIPSKLFDFSPSNPKKP